MLRCKKNPLGRRGDTEQAFKNLNRFVGQLTPLVFQDLDGFKKDFGLKTGFLRMCDLLVLVFPSVLDFQLVFRCLDIG